MLLGKLSKDLHIVDSPFEKALSNEDINAIKRLVKEGKKLNAHYTLALTPLHSAIRYGKSLSFIKDLLELGSDPNLTEQKEGRSPLYDAAWSENEPLVSLLLEYGANPNISDKDKWTPLFCAAWRGHESIARTLIKYNAKKAARDIYQKTPLTKAMENSQLGVHYVLSTYVSIYSTNLKKLIRHIRKGNEQEVESALADGFPINLGNDDGESLLMIAVKAGNHRSLISC
jgi:ankyrin repeat protein